MANEIQCSFQTGLTLYAIVRGLSNHIGQAWNTSSGMFEAYLTVDITNYAVAMVEQGVASGFYTGNFPAAIPPGSYSVVAKQQKGGAAAETDPTVAVGNIDWNGTYPAPLSDLSTSGQLSLLAPLKIYRGQQILNFPFKLVSAADHVTPFVSGVVSGQISRDGGLFGALQSGAFTEIGKGFYSLQAFTSGDLLANTAAVTFTANGISGGTADPRDFIFILQRTSGSV